MILIFLSTVLAKTTSERVDFRLTKTTPGVIKSSTKRKVSSDINALTTFLVSNGVKRQTAEAFVNKLKFSKTHGIIEHTFQFTNYGKEGDFRRAWKFSRVIKGAKNGNNYAIEISNVDRCVTFDYKYCIIYTQKAFLKKTKRWYEYHWKPLTPDLINQIQDDITKSQKSDLEHLASKRVAV